MRTLFSFCVCVSMSIDDVASQSLYPGIVGKDDRVRLTQEGSPWDAIGHVNIGGFRRRGICTGTLVAPNLVLTAAHCVVDPWKREPYRLERIHFVAGVSGEKYKAHAKAKCLRFPPGYKYWPLAGRRSSTSSRRQGLQAFLKDAVVIVLKDRLSIAPVPLQKSARPRIGLRLLHASYPADRRYALSAHLDCHLMRADPNGRLWLVDCDTHFASSGGPIFVSEGKVLKLAAIMVGSANSGLNVAVPTAIWKSLAHSDDCPK
ncbi:MAG: trypsin-like serine peptidase [Hyphomicrobiaceae bacterium]